MKQLKSILLTALFLCLICGCGEKQQTPDPAVPSDSIQETSVEALTGQENAADKQIDLTQMSSTMVYSEVYNMMSKPSDYIGKNIKMKGNLSVYRDEASGSTYYACVIADATACCSQGLEFLLKGDQKYPKEGTEITVSGRFETYYEGEDLYCHLVDAVLA